MLQAVLFDLDGTLTDSVGDLADSGNDALRRAGLPTFTDAEYAARVGNGIDKLIERILPANFSNGLFAQVKKDFYAHYDGHYCVRTRAYDGMKETVALLKAAGVLCGVVSNKPNPFTIKVVESLYGVGTFDMLSGQRDGVPNKPDPFLVNEMIEKMGADRKQVLFVGDSDVDIRTGKNAGLTALGVTWGYRSRAVLEENGADYIFDTADDLQEFLKKNLTK